MNLDVKALILIFIATLMLFVALIISNPKVDVDKCKIKCKGAPYSTEGKCCCFKSGNWTCS